MDSQPVLDWTHHYRVVPSRFPTTTIFDHVNDPEELEILWMIESMTNDRLRAEVGNLDLLPREEWQTGPGTTPLMSAFCHTGKASRYTNGDYGVYYAANSMTTAVKEHTFHFSRFMAATNEPYSESTVRCYFGELLMPLHDLRSNHYIDYHSADINTYEICQQLAKQLRQLGSYGIYYPSARDQNGECIALFRPSSSTPVQQAKHYKYIWDGEQIIHVLEVTASPILL